MLPLKDKRGVTIVNALQKILDSSIKLHSTELHSKSSEGSKGSKLNKIWVDQGGKFYNNVFKRFLNINNIEMHWAHNKGKSIVAERMIKTLRNKIYKHMTAIFKKCLFWCFGWYWWKIQ